MPPHYGSKKHSESGLCEEQYICGNSSVDRALAFQAGGRGFESRFPLSEWGSYESSYLFYFVVFRGLGLSTSTETSTIFFSMKASISVICYKYKTLSNGESPLMLRIHKDGKRKLVSIGLSIHPQLWDFTKNEPKPKCPNKDLIGKATRLWPFWPRRIVPFGYNMIDPFGQNRIDHLVYLLS